MNSVVRVNGEGLPFIQEFDFFSSCLMKNSNTRVNSLELHGLLGKVLVSVPKEELVQHLILADKATGNTNAMPSLSNLADVLFTAVKRIRFIKLVQC